MTATTPISVERMTPDDDEDTIERRLGRPLARDGFEQTVATHCSGLRARIHGWWNTRARSGQAVTTASGLLATRTIWSGYTVEILPPVDAGVTWGSVNWER